MGKLFAMQQQHYWHKANNIKGKERKMTLSNFWKHKTCIFGSSFIKVYSVGKWPYGKKMKGYKLTNIINNYDIEARCINNEYITF